MEVLVLEVDIHEGYAGGRDRRGGRGENTLRGYIGEKKASLYRLRNRELESTVHLAGYEEH